MQRYLWDSTLVQNSIKSLCRPRDSENLSFLDLLRFSPFCATFSDNLVTVEQWESFHTLSVTGSIFRALQIDLSSRMA